MAPHQFSSPVRGLAVVVLAAALVGCGAQSSSGSSPPTTPIITDVIDGDTIVVTFGAHRQTVRLLGIDTPESVDPNRPVQCFGAEASDRLAAIVAAGNEVRLERDVEARDRYGRLLAYLFVDGVMVNETLLAEGLGELSIYEPNGAYRSRLTAAETKARTAVIGLWRVCGGPDVPLDPPPP